MLFGAGLATGDGAGSGAEEAGGVPVGSASGWCGDALGEEVFEGGGGPKFGAEVLVEGVELGKVFLGLEDEGIRSWVRALRLRAFQRELALPAWVRGPVDLAALRR